MNPHEALLLLIQENDLCYKQYRSGLASNKIRLNCAVAKGNMLNSSKLILRHSFWQKEWLVV